MSPSFLSRFCAPADDVLAIHVMRELTSLQREGRVATLADLAGALGVRRADVRRVVSALHRQGYVDALRMKPTLAGFALGSALIGAELTPMRKVDRALIPAA
jgi:DNA-binding Lrp family transcriptional regulator